MLGRADSSSSTKFREWSELDFSKLDKFTESVASYFDKPIPKNMGNDLIEKFRNEETVDKGRTKTRQRKKKVDNEYDTDEVAEKEVHEKEPTVSNVHSSTKDSSDGHGEKFLRDNFETISKIFTVFYKRYGLDDETNFNNFVNTLKNWRKNKINNFALFDKTLMKCKDSPELVSSIQVLTNSLNAHAEEESMRTHGQRKETEEKGPMADDDAGVQDFLNRVRKSLDLHNYQIFLDILIDLRALYKCQKYELAAQKLEVIKVMLTRTNPQLRVELDTYFPVIRAISSKARQEKAIFNQPHSQDYYNNWPAGAYNYMPYPGMPQDPSISKGPPNGADKSKSSQNSKHGDKEMNSYANPSGVGGKVPRMMPPYPPAGYDHFPPFSGTGMYDEFAGGRPGNPVFPMSAIPPIPGSMGQKNMPRGEGFPGMPPDMRRNMMYPPPHGYGQSPKQNFEFGYPPGMIPFMVPPGELMSPRFPPGFVPRGLPSMPQALLPSVPMGYPPMGKSQQGNPSNSNQSGLQNSQQSNQQVNSIHLSGNPLLQQNNSNIPHVAAQKRPHQTSSTNVTQSPQRSVPLATHNAEKLSHTENDIPSASQSSEDVERPASEPGISSHFTIDESSNEGIDDADPAAKKTKV